MTKIENLIKDICGEDIIEQYDIDSENITDILTDEAESRIMSAIQNAQETALAKEIEKWKSLR